MKTRILLFVLISNYLKAQIVSEINIGTGYTFVVEQTQLPSYESYGLGKRIDFSIGYQFESDVTTGFRVSSTENLLEIQHQDFNYERLYKAKTFLIFLRKLYGDTFVYGFDMGAGMRDESVYFTGEGGYFEAFSNTEGKKIFQMNFSFPLGYEVLENQHIFISPLIILNDPVTYVTGFSREGRFSRFGEDVSIFLKLGYQIKW